MPGCGTLRRSMIPMPCDALSFQVYQVISHDGRYPPETIPPGDIFCHFLQADCFSRRLHRMKCTIIHTKNTTLR